MSQRLRNGRLLSMMDDPAMRGLRAYLTGARVRRDGEGHAGGGGGTGSDDNDDSGGDDDKDDADEDEDDKSKKDKASSDDDEKDDGEGDPTVPQWKYEKLEKRMRAADARASAREKELAALKAAKAGEADEAIKKEFDEVTKTNAKLAEENKDLRIRLAFTTTKVKGVEWEDPDAALKLLDMADVDIDEETGKIDRRSLVSAMKDLAKNKPYLVKKSDAGGSASGSQMNGGRKGETKTADRAALAKRFPVLGRQS